MDMSKIKSERISVCAKGKIVDTFFPGCAEDEIITDENLSLRAQDMHAGALSLYAATLLTKVYENAPVKIENECRARKQDYINQIKLSPKFLGRPESEILEIADNMISRDIRNSFAHGNFEISYDIYTKKLYFILKPRRKDFISNEPILISKSALMKVNRQFVASSGSQYFGLGRGATEERFANSFSQSFKTLIFPVQMLKLSEYYLEPKDRFKTELSFKPKDFTLIQYLLCVAKLTYEQDDYYQIFGKDSKIFEKIAIIRNAVAHDSFMFNESLAVSYDDRTKNINESFQKSVGLLALANIQKDEAIKQKQRGKLSSEHIHVIAKLFDDCFDVISRNFDNPDFRSDEKISE